MERQWIARRRLLGAGAARLAGAISTTAAPKGLWAAGERDYNTRVGEINRHTWLDISGQCSGGPGILIEQGADASRQQCTGVGSHCALIDPPCNTLARIV